MGRKAPSRVVALLALDDTDTRDGGCTTHVAHRVASALQEAGGPLANWGLVAPPRLVRLCPAIRDKTRGNGALVLPIGPTRPAAPGAVIGATPEGQPLVVRPAALQEPPWRGEAVAALQHLMTAHLPDAASDAADPQPAALLLPDAAARWLYEQAVVGRVSSAEAWRAVPASTRRLTPPHRRGEIGAAAAAAWRPTLDTMTWEAIGYRVGRDTQRQLPAGFGERLAALPGGFDNIDGTTGRIRAIPRTPCPVRFGARGLDPAALRALAADVAPTAGGAGWWLVATNHARGDTLGLAGSEIAAERSVQVAVTVDAEPERRRGGHVFVDTLGDNGRPVRLAAYEPTKGFARTTARLRPGDRLVAFGRTGLGADVVALEAFRILHQEPRVLMGPNPRCACGAAMKSRGRGAGYRCRRCGRDAGLRTKPARHWCDIALAIGSWHQVPDHVRGHLLPPVGGLGPARPLEAAPLEPDGSIMLPA